MRKTKYLFDFMKFRLHEQQLLLPLYLWLEEAMIGFQLDNSSALNHLPVFRTSTQTQGADIVIGGHVVQR